MRSLPCARPPCNACVHACGVHITAASHPQTGSTRARHRRWHCCTLALEQARLPHRHVCLLCCRTERCCRRCMVVKHGIANDVVLLVVLPNLLSSGVRSGWTGCIPAAWRPRRTRQSARYGRTLGYSDQVGVELGCTGIHHYKACGLSVHYWCGNVSWKCLFCACLWLQEDALLGRTAATLPPPSSAGAPPQGGFGVTSSQDVSRVRGDGLFPCFDWSFVCVLRSASSVLPATYSDFFLRNISYHVCCCCTAVRARR